MQRSYSFLLALLTIILMFIGCGQKPDAPAEPVKPAQFTIVDKDGIPMLTADQIVSYNWASHTLTLRPGVSLEPHSPDLVNGILFTIMAGEDACYQGVVTTSLSSRSQSVPIINIDRRGGDEGMLQIELGYPTAAYFKGEDPRSDERVREALRADGKLED